MQPKGQHVEAVASGVSPSLHHLPACGWDICGVGACGRQDKASIPASPENRKMLGKDTNGEVEGGGDG